MRAAGAAAGRDRGCPGRWVNWLNRSMSGPSELPRIVRNDGAILARSMFRAMAEPSPSNAATWAARPAASAALSNSDHVGVGLGLGEDRRCFVFGGFELGLRDLELLLGQRHGHLLLFLGLGGLLDDLLLGLDHALLLLGQHDLDLQFRLGELLELLTHELGELLLGDLTLLHRLGDVLGGWIEVIATARISIPCFWQFSVRLLTRSV